MSAEYIPDDLKVECSLGKAELRASYTTLTYINDDVTSPDYVSPEIIDEQSNPANNPSENGLKSVDILPNTKIHTQAGAEGSTNDLGLKSPQNGKSFKCNEGNGHTKSSSIENTNGQANVQIQTRHIESQYDSSQTPLTRRRIQLLKGFSIAAAIFFFPTGIPAAFYAFKINKALQEGIMQGNIDWALKLSRRTEKFIILSAVLGVLFIVMCFAIIERAIYGHEYYWHTGTMIGH